MTAQKKAPVIDAEKDVSPAVKENLNRKIADRQNSIAKRPAKDARVPNSVSMGAVYVRMTLQTTYAQKLYVQSFSRTCKALYYLSFVLYEHLQDEKQMEQVSKLNEVVEGYLKEAMEEMSERIDIMNATMAARPELAAAEIHFSTPHELSVRITTPRILQLKTLLEQCDEWHQKANLLWNLNAMSDKDRVMETKKVNGNFKGLCNKVIKLHTDVEKEIGALRSGKSLSLSAE